jgi:hypothetical protein
MKRNYLHLELLLGREVLDANGRKVGRIEEAIARKRGGEWVVTEFLCGSFGMMERFSIHHFGSVLMHRLGATGTTSQAQRIKWDELDLSDPEHPRLKKRPS